MSETQALLGDAGERFDRAVDFAVEDAELRLLRYHLIRLTVVGLSRDEVPALVELARQAFDGRDVTDQVRAVRERPGASALASAIAGIVERSRPGDPFARRGDVLIGAVIGAYTAMTDAGSGKGDDGVAAAVLGAVGGGTAVSVGRFIQDRIAEVGVAEYLRVDEQS
jgi:hypothetical protein